MQARVILESRMDEPVDVKESESVESASGHRPLEAKSSSYQVGSSSIDQLM